MSCSECRGYRLVAPCPVCSDDQRPESNPLVADENLFDVVQDDKLIATVTEEEAARHNRSRGYFASDEDEGHITVTNSDGKEVCTLIRQHQDSMDLWRS